MSLPGKRRQISQNQKNLRSKSVENKKKISFNKEQSNQLSINTILEHTAKSVNQNIISQYSKHGEQGPSSNQQANNLNKLEAYTWEIAKIEEKRKIKGIKAKFMWSNGKDSTWIMVRVVLTDNYIRMNEPQYFMELDSANIDLSIDQQKALQKHINQVIEEQQQKLQQMKNQVFFWLKTALISIHNVFISMKLHQRKKVRQLEFKRFAINKNYMLYPCPASITWSPHGMLCLTENKVGVVSKPIVGNIYSYRNLIEAPYKFQRFARKNNEIDDLKMVEERREEEEETTEAQFFGWDVKEEINFSIFGKLTEEETTGESPSQNSPVLENQIEKSEKRIVKDHQTFYIGNTNNITPKLEKIYRRHFAAPGQNAEFQFLQKLKVFTLKNQKAQLEDGILYLVDKIQRHNRAGVIDALLENQFTGYHGTFSKSSKQQHKFQRLRYELITQFLQEKIKATPQSQHFLYMKCILIENQFFRLALQNYFQESFARLNFVGPKFEKLGTFDNFDQFASQKAVFLLLQQTIKAEKNLKSTAQKIKQQYRQKPQKYDDPKYKQHKYGKMFEQNFEMKLILKGYVKKASKNGHDDYEKQPFSKLLRTQSGIKIEELSNNRTDRNVNLNMMPFLVVNKVQFVPLQFNMILTPAQRKNFLETVIPILWIKDRSSEKFEYKQAKRVIIANSKIINFHQKMLGLGNQWKKMDSGKKNNFLRTIIREYHNFEKKIQAPLGKVYIAYCHCMDNFTAYNIEELLRVTKCSRCRYLEGGN